MASKQLFLIVAIHSVIALATDYKVGDAQGWTVNFNYTAWAEGKEFWVGDKLVFTYPTGIHNVIKADGAVFQSCKPGKSNEVLSSGNDTITLATEGKKWYICGFADHCSAKGQKLTITVKAQAPAPAPSSANGITTVGYQVTVLAAVAIVMLIMG